MLVQDDMKALALILTCRPSGMRSLSILTNHAALVTQNRLESSGFETISFY